MFKKTADTQTSTPQEYLQGRYARVLIPEPDGAFSAEILEFPGCYSQGNTADEAMRNLEDAALNWVEAALAMNQHIPEPSDTGDASGRVALRLPRNIHRKAVQLAERERVSLNTFLLEAIASRVGAEDLYARIAQRLDEKISMLEQRAEAVTTSSVWDKAFDLLGDQTKSTADTPRSPLLMSVDRLQIRGV